VRVDAGFCPGDCDPDDDVRAERARLRVAPRRRAARLEQERYDLGISPLTFVVEKLVTGSPTSFAVDLIDERSVRTPPPRHRARDRSGEGHGSAWPRVPHRAVTAGVDRGERFARSSRARTAYAP
jgi:hypothetical protein